MNLSFVNQNVIHCRGGVLNMWYTHCITFWNSTGIVSNTGKNDLEHFGILLSLLACRSNSKDRNKVCLVLLIK